VKKSHVFSAVKSYSLLKSECVCWTPPSHQSSVPGRSRGFREHACLTSGVEWPERQTKGHLPARHTRSGGHGRELDTHGSAQPDAGACALSDGRREGSAWPSTLTDTLWFASVTTPRSPAGGRPEAICIAQVARGLAFPSPNARTQCWIAATRISAHSGASAMRWHACVAARLWH